MQACYTPGSVLVWLTRCEHKCDLLEREVIMKQLFNFKVNVTFYAMEEQNIRYILMQQRLLETTINKHCSFNIALSQ